MRRILTALLAATALAGAFQTATAEALGPSRCYQWDIGQARFNQSNGWVVQFDFRHGAFRTFGGQARTWDNRGNFAGFGTVQGTMIDDDLNFSIRWNSGATGIYYSRLNRFGQAFGTTWDMYRPSSQATWWMVDSARCLRWA